MANKKFSNYPQGQATQALNGDEQTGNIINCIMDLSDHGKPQTTEELKQRIDDYFLFCGTKNFRPGVESLSLSLGISRVTFWAWTNEGCGKPKEWIEICQLAKQKILSFTEAAALSGKLNPATSIFLLKNLGGYKDSVSFEEITPTTNKTPMIVEYPKLGEDNPTLLPPLPEYAN